MSNSREEMGKKGGGGGLERVNTSRQRNKKGWEYTKNKEIWGGGGIFTRPIKSVALAAERTRDGQTESLSDGTVWESKKKG